MNHWLLKTEPDVYSWSDLVRDKRTTWDGIANALALKYLRTFASGDLAFLYHTGGVKAVVGIASVVGKPYADPKQDDEKSTVVDLKPKSPLANPVTLAQIKADPAFAGFDLIRIGRLSVVPVPPAMWKRIVELGGG